MRPGTPTYFHQNETRQGDTYQYEDNRNVSTNARLRKTGKDIITERQLQHRVKTKGKEEATGVDNRYKRPALKDKEVARYYGTGDQVQDVDGEQDIKRDNDEDATDPGTTHRRG